MTPAETLAEAASNAGALVEERGASAALLHYGLEPVGAIKVAWTLAHGDEDKASSLLHGVIVGLAFSEARERTNEAA